MNRVDTIWYIPDQIIHVSYIGAMTAQHLQASSDELTAMLCSVDGTVHIIADMTHVTDYPKNLKQITKLIQVVNEPNIGWVISVSNNPMLDFFTQIVAQLANIRFKTVTSGQAARAYLAVKDPTLPDLPAYPNVMATE